MNSWHGDWIDENIIGIGQTARCPGCSIDSVIGSDSGYSITQEFLAKMERHWYDMLKFGSNGYPIG